MPAIEVVIADEEPRIVRVCESYWAVDDNGSFVYTVKALAQHFELTSREVTSLATGRSHAYIVDPACPRCGKGMLVRTRSDFTNLIRVPPSACADCTAELRAEAQLETDRIESERRILIQRRYGVVEDEPILVASLPLRAAFTIASLLRDGEGATSGTIRALSSRAERLAPMPSFSRDLVREVWNSQLIRVHPDSPMDVFDWTAGDPNGIYLDKAPFYLRGRGELGERCVDFARDFESIVDFELWPQTWTRELDAFWKDLAVAEATEYLVFCLAQHRLEFSPGEQTRATISKGLDWFTLGQTFNLIWRAAKDAAAYYTRESVAKAQAANSAVTRLRGFIERAYAEGWDVKPYSRNSKLGTSTITHLLYTRSLHLADPLAFNPTGSERSPLRLRWEHLSANSFERLIFCLVSEAEGYTDVDWLMKTNAPDHGRDIGAARMHYDSLSGYAQERLVVQCKHWLSRSVTDSNIAGEVTAIGHWEHPPVDTLAIATSGRFTANAVSWVERHNAKGVRPGVEMWNDSKLESLLATRPHLVIQFELR